MHIRFRVIENKHFSGQILLKFYTFKMIMNFIKFAVSELLSEPNSLADTIHLQGQLCKSIT